MTNQQFLNDPLQDGGEPQEATTSVAKTTHGRRKFLASLGGLSALAMGSSLLSAKSARTDALATAGASKNHQFARPVYGGEPHMLDNLTKEVFEAHLNTSFKAHSLGASDEEAQSAPVKLELVSVEAGSGHDPRNGYESFSLLFRGPADAPLEQNTYELRHKTLGQPAIFIVPVSRDENGFYYEAIFNRLQRA